MTVKSNGPDTDFGYVCTLTLTLQKWTWVNVMTHPWVIHGTTSVWNIIQIQLGCEDVYTVTLTFEIWLWLKIMTHPGVANKYCVKYYSYQIWQWGVMIRTRISGMCTLWPWTLRYDLESMSWHTLRSLRTLRKCVKYYPDPTLCHVQRFRFSCKCLIHFESQTSAKYNIILNTDHKHALCTYRHILTIFIGVSASSWQEATLLSFKYYLQGYKDFSRRRSTDCGGKLRPLVSNVPRNVAMNTWSMYTCGAISLNLSMFKNLSLIIPILTFFNSRIAF